MRKSVLSGKVVSSKEQQWRYKLFLVLTFLITYHLSLITALQAINPQDWLKKVGQQKARRVTQKQATIAAVRGVDEPNQVDPNARNYEAVAQMEKKQFAQEKVNQFASAGKLMKTKIETPSASAGKGVKK